jgi:molybdate transport system regulatory protein
MSKAKKPKSAHLWIRIVIPEGGAIGPGKIDLLRAIGDVQSISAAARELDMSYRRAWMLLDETKRALNAEVIETRSGGADRGGASLTPTGRALIDAYDRIYAAANAAVAADLKKLGIPPPKAAKGAKRKRAA